MNLKAPVKQVINKLLQPLGITVIGTQYYQRMTMIGAIQALHDRHYQFKTIIDIGASDGHWSALAMQQYPDANYLLVEAQPTHEPKLQQFVQERNSSEYVLAAAGEKPGQLYFNASDPLSGQASYTPYASEHNLVVPVARIDDEVVLRNLPGPFLLKLDTHGFEVPILQGAIETLKSTEAIIMECYNFKIAPECLLFHEMCSYLSEFGFRCIDFIDPLYRPYDNSFWQADLVFVKDTRPEFKSLRYNKAPTPSR
jgi:FkbM family methyltransferase